MNPNATSFVFNPTVTAWAPPVAPVPVAPAAAPVAVEEAKEPDDGSGTRSPLSPMPLLTAPSTEEIDENDPLWKATLELSLGDRNKAMKLLEDPDALMAFPEIRAIMEAQDAAEATQEDWEIPTPASESAIPDAGPVIPEPVPTSSRATPVPVPGEKEEEEEVTETAVIAEGDPREHLNLVFIGHVDAGNPISLPLCACAVVLLCPLYARVLVLLVRSEDEQDGAFSTSSFLAERRPLHPSPVPIPKADPFSQVNPPSLGLSCTSWAWWTRARSRGTRRRPRRATASPGTWPSCWIPLRRRELKVSALPLYFCCMSCVAMGCCFFAIALSRFWRCQWLALSPESLLAALCAIRCNDTACSCLCGHSAFSLSTKCPCHTRPTSHV